MCVRLDWSKFSITVVEVCPRESLRSRENWYLSRYNPLLNVLMTAGERADLPGLSLLTRSKISLSLTGRKDSEDTRTKKSISRLGELNPFFLKRSWGKSLRNCSRKGWN